MLARREEALFVARVQEVTARLRASSGLSSFAELVPTELLQRLLAELGVVFREGVYTPAVTVWMFLSQVLSADHSCRDVDDARHGRESGRTNLRSVPPAAVFAESRLGLSDRPPRGCAGRPVLRLVLGLRFAGSTERAVGHAAASTSHDRLPSRQTIG